MEMNPIERTIRERLAEQTAVFVFPTQTAADLWSDRATTFGRTAVASERFVSWDVFKGSSIRGRSEGRRSVPSLMRQVFAADLVRRNAESPFLRSVIVPEFAGEASAFARWIAKMLPSLADWKARVEERAATTAGAEGNSFDDEDRDIGEIHARYEAFLDANGLFDPAWETPPFRDDGNDYYIFFPEILTDYAEYERILGSAERVHLVSAAELGRKAEIPAVLYENSRVELREAAAALRKIHGDGIPWTEIALSVPDLDTYAPYIERELTLAQIPFSMRSGSSLAATPAGSLFPLASECVSGGFPFAAVKRLLMNTSLPWRDPAMNAALVAYGRDNNCLCSYEYGGKFHDSWEDSFREQREGRPRADEKMQSFYREKFKPLLTALVRAESFGGMLQKYFALRDGLFDMERCPPESDDVISTCVKKLHELARLEQDFGEGNEAVPAEFRCRVPSPFQFFAAQLAEEHYVPQTDARGVQVFAYRNAAAAPFAAHVVVDASQDALSVASLYRRLPFLNDEKREMLGIRDSDPTEDFIRIYAASLAVPGRFSAAKKTFTGYAFPHGLLKAEDRSPSPGRPRPALEYDAMAAERSALLERTDGEERYAVIPPNGGSYPSAIPRTMADGFFEWSAASSPLESLGIGRERTLRLVEETLRDGETGLWRVTQSALKAFAACPRLWLFRHVLRARAQDNEAALVDPFTLGQVRHDVLDGFCRALAERGLTLHAEAGGLDEIRGEILRDAVRGALGRRSASRLSRELISTDSAALVERMGASIAEFSRWFDGFEVKASEREYALDTGKGWRLEGRIDCLLLNPAEASLTLVDYKSTKASFPKNLYAADGKAADPQMPMYRRLVEGAEGEVANAAFFSIKEGAAKFVFGRPVTERGKGAQADEEDFSPTMEAFDAQCAEYVARVSSGDFSIDAARQTFPVCTGKDCADYRAACRRFFNVSGR